MLGIKPWGCWVRSLCASATQYLTQLEFFAAGESDNDMFGFVTEGVLLTTVSALGFVGNLLSVWILLKSSLRGNFSKQLTSLAGLTFNEYNSGRCLIIEMVVFA